METDVENSREPRRHRIWKNPIVVLLGSTVLFIGVQMLGAILFLPLTQNTSNTNIQLLIMSGGNLLVLGVGLVIFKRIVHAGWRAFGLSWPSWRAVAEVVPALLLYFTSSLVVTLLATQFIPGFDAEQVQDIGFGQLHTPLELIAAFLTLVVLVPIFEEVLFRGVLFKGLRHRVPFWLSAVVTSLIFATAHGQLNVAVDTFALSLLLCFLVERHDSIVPSIMLHALKNSLAFSLLFVFK